MRVLVDGVVRAGCRASSPARADVSGSGRSGRCRPATSPRMPIEAGLTPPIAVDSARTVPISITATTITTIAPSRTGIGDGRDRSAACRRRPGSQAQAPSSGSDPADEVAGGHVEMALQDRRHRDRQLGEAARDRQQDDAAERLTETQAHVERVVVARSATRRPGDDCGRDEDRGRGAATRARSRASTIERGSAGSPEAWSPQWSRVASRTPKAIRTVPLMPSMILRMRGRRSTSPALATNAP